MHASYLVVKVPIFVYCFNQYVTHSNILSIFCHFIIVKYTSFVKLLYSPNDYLKLFVTDNVSNIETYLVT